MVCGTEEEQYTTHFLEVEIPIFGPMPQLIMRWEKDFFGKFLSSKKRV